MNEEKKNLEGECNFYDMCTNKIKDKDKCTESKYVQSKCPGNEYCFNGGIPVRRDYWGLSLK